MSTVYPWNAELWQRLHTTNDRLPQTLMFTGPPGMGKLEFALELARTRLCDEQGDKACGECHPCRLFNAGSLPDLHLITSEVFGATLSERDQLFAGRYFKERPKNRKPSAVIIIDRVRELIDRLNTHAHIAKQRVAILCPAQALNESSSNSLLKLIEEPPTNTLLILVTSAPGRLLPTIRSRCATFRFHPPSEASAAAWLAENGVSDSVDTLLRMSLGAPLRALALHNAGEGKRRKQMLGDVVGLANRSISPIAVAEKWRDGRPDEVLKALVGAVDEWIRAVQTGSGSSELQAAGQGLDLKKVHTARSEIAHSAATWDTSLDEALVLEEAFLRLARMRP